MKHFILTLLLVFLGACEKNLINNQKNYSDEISVSLILKTHDKKQTAMITRVKPFDSDLAEYIFVDSVKLYVEDRLFRFIPADSMRYNRYCWNSVVNVSKCYNYYIDSLSILSGRAYHLRAFYEDKVIEGRTDTPGDFSITTDRRTISWSQSVNAVLYRISVRGPSDFILERVTKQTQITLDDDDFISGSYRITVEALDKNFYELAYDRTQQAGLSGAYGVFGSVNAKTIETNLR